MRDQQRRPDADIRTLLARVTPRRRRLKKHRYQRMRRAGPRPRLRHVQRADEEGMFGKLHHAYCPFIIGPDDPQGTRSQKSYSRRTDAKVAVVALGGARTTVDP